LVDYIQLNFYPFQKYLKWYRIKILIRSLKHFIFYAELAQINSILLFPPPSYYPMNSSTYPISPHSFLCSGSTFAIYCSSLIAVSSFHQTYATKLDSPLVVLVWFISA